MSLNSLVELIFSAGSIERWNDHIRPSRGFTELDKQAHKMLYSYILSGLSDDIDRVKLVDGAIFELLHRLVLTDIKPPVFHRLMTEKGEQINKWVISSLKDNLEEIPCNFFEKFKEYYENPDYSKNEKQLLNSAHYLATKWEFDIIYSSNSTYYGIDKTRREIDLKLESFNSLSYFNQFNHNENLKGFASLSGQLRFQQRWSKTPRLPATSVMGHMLIVAVLSYLSSCYINACPKRLTNNFFGGLFHDVPEVLTRDIVSPVKNSVEGLDELIKEIEEIQMQETIYPLIPKEWQTELDYFTRNEFSSKIIKDGEILILTTEEIQKSYNEDIFCPIDGEIIRVCDVFGAFIETYFSHITGVTSPILRSANKDIYSAYKNTKIGSLDFSPLFEEFKI
ncbi:MAG: HD domain-containing protein [Ruminococcaceae bacterium]|nr:HD domain-containing protein [Oscillospiraceae bacterium]